MALEPVELAGPVLDEAERPGPDRPRVGRVRGDVGALVEMTRQHGGEGREGVADEIERGRHGRTEEDTPELLSRPSIVCRFLLAIYVASNYGSPFSSLIL